MTASDAESWARLRLVQGESSAEKWELVSSLGHTTLTVGSGSDCNWVVREEGVRPLHFSLHWDGNTLRVADVYSAGDVRVDGQLLTSQWRPLLGRVRLDFGNAAMVVETSATAAGQAEHPLDLGRPKAGSSHPPRNAPAAQTLLGISPRAGAAPSPVLHGYVPGRAGSEPPASGPGAADLIRPSRGGAANSMKSTLVGGIAVGGSGSSSPSSFPPPSPRATPSSAPPPGPSPARNVGPKTNATLMGFSVSESLRGAGVGKQPSVPVGSGAPGPAPSEKPSSGYPGSRRKTQQGVGAAVGGAEVVGASPSADASPQARIGSAWQETADADGFTGGVSGPEGAPRNARTRGEPRDFAERLSDIPTQMRDPATFTSRRPSQGIPWRYVGVLLLTGIAYFAWLYLLDHL